MSQVNKTSWLAAAAMACLVAAGPTTAPVDSADAPRTDADLAAALPLETAVLPDRMSPDVYRQRFEKLKDQLDPTPAADDLYTQGVVIVAIDPAAKSKDLKVGDVIVAVDGTEVATPADYNGVRNDTKAQTFLVCRGFSAAAKPVQVAEGLLRLTLVQHPLLANEYLKALKPGEKPSDDLRVAAGSMQVNLPLAYAALAAARDQQLTGSNGWWRDQLTALALYSDARYEGALTAATAAVADAPAAQRPLTVNMQVVSALATGRFDLVAKIADDEPKAAELVQAAKMDADIAKAVDRAKPRPNPAAAKLDFKDRVADLVNTALDANGEKRSSQSRIDDWQSSGSIPFSTRGGSYAVCQCSPAAPNVKFTADCRFAATDNRPTQYVRVLRVGVSSDDGFGREIELYVDGTANVQTPDGKPVAPLYLGRLTGNGRAFRLQMVVVGDRYEFDVDGRRVGYGSMPPTADGSSRQYSLSIQTVGVTGEFHNAHWATAASK